MVSVRDDGACYRGGFPRGRGPFFFLYERTHVHSRLRCATVLVNRDLSKERIHFSKGPLPFASFSMFIN